MHSGSILVPSGLVECAPQVYHEPIVMQARKLETLAWRHSQGFLTAMLTSCLPKLERPPREDWREMRLSFFEDLFVEPHSE